MEKMSDEMNLKLQMIKNNLMTSMNSKPVGTKAKSSKKKTGGEAKAKKPTGEKKTKSTKKEETKKKTSKLKDKKKSAKSENEDTDTDITTSRKWDDRKKNKEDIKVGKFDKKEEQIIIDAFCDYGYANNLDEEQMIQFITEKQTKTDKSIWSAISEALPNRAVQSIHNFCHRKLNPYNYKGGWSVSEEKKLMDLYEEHGTKWNLIAKELERTPTNVKDKFKQMGGKNYKQRNNEFTLVLSLKLLKYIQDWLDDTDQIIELNNIEEKIIKSSKSKQQTTKENVISSYKILKYDYKFRKDLEKKHNLVYLLDQENSKFLIDNCIKDSESRIIIKNILKMIVDISELERLLENKVEISWSFISNKFVVYSAQDCKNNFDRILRDFDLFKNSQIKKDLKMVKQ